MIRAVTGRGGAGKSFQLARAACHGLWRGVDVWGNFKFDREEACRLGWMRGSVRVPETERILDRCGKYHEIHSFEELVGIQHGLLLFDELQLWAFSREFYALPYQALLWWSQCRKHEVDVMFAAQALDAVDVALRRLTHEEWRCRPALGGFLMRRTDPLVEKRHGHMGWRYTRFDVEIASLYDTRQLLSPPGWEERAARLRSSRRRKTSELVEAGGGGL